MSYSMDVGPTDDCPVCDSGKLVVAPGETVPRDGTGGPRTLICNNPECAFSLTSNLYGPDDHSPGGF